MSANSLFLAASDAEGGKVVVGIIVFVFWAIGTLVKAFNKKQQEESARQQARVLLEMPPPPPPIPQLAPQVQMRVPPVRQKPPQVQQQVPQQQIQRPAPGRKIIPANQRKQINRPSPFAQGPPTPVTDKRRVKLSPAIQSTEPAPITSALGDTHQEISATEIQSPDARKKTTGVNAEALHRWLRPSTLRQQFILTELLQPPLALRPGREM